MNTPPVDLLIKQATKAIDSYEPLLAIKFLLKAFNSTTISNNETSASLSEISQLIAECHLESISLPEIIQQDAMDSAKEWFLKSISFSPPDNSSPENYLHMGQLTSGILVPFT